MLGAHDAFADVLVLEELFEYELNRTMEKYSLSEEEALAKMIEPMHVTRRDADGTVVFSVSIVFRDSLFAGEAHVKPDGLIILQNEELLVEDIPVADDLFGQ